jgi:hypothetical protein
MTEPNKITFCVSGENFITLNSNGDIYVKGNLVKNDLEVVNAMREFLIKSGMLKENENA